MKQLIIGYTNELDDASKDGMGDRCWVVRITNDGLVWVRKELETEIQGQIVYKPLADAAVIDLARNISPEDFSEVATNKLIQQFNVYATAKRENNYD